MYKQLDNNLVSIGSVKAAHFDMAMHTCPNFITFRGRSAIALLPRLVPWLGGGGTRETHLAYVTRKIARHRA